MHVMTSLCSVHREDRSDLKVTLCWLSLGCTQRAFDFLFFVLSYFGSKTVAIFDSTLGAVGC
jgi:hypothetical protein